MKEIILQLKKLEKASKVEEERRIELEMMLRDKIEFDFSIQFQRSDGYLIQENDRSEVAGIASCLKTIQEEGSLTLDSFQQLVI